MAIYGNTFDAFTIAFAALSLVLAGASTFGDFWVTFGGIGDEVSEAGLWEACLRVGKEKKCTRYARITGNALIVVIGMVTFSGLLLLGFIVSIIKKCSRQSEYGQKVVAGILTSLLFLGAAAGITALAYFTVESNKLVNSFENVHYGWSYFSGWAAVLFACVCIGSSIASLFHRQTNAQIGSNMQVIGPNTYPTSVPYHELTVSTSNNRVI